MSWRDNVYYRYFEQQPPVTRTYLAAIVAVSLPPLLYLVSPAYFINYWDYTLRGELWRPLTAFLYGGGGLSVLFGIFFAYQYSLQLETEKFGDSTADYAYYLLFSMVNIMFLNYFVSSNWYFNALTLSLCTTAVLERPIDQTNLFGMIKMQAQYLPYALLALTFVQAGPHEAMGTGLVNAYIWRHLRETMPAQGGLNYLATPSWMYSIFGHGGFLASTAQTASDGGTARPFGHAFRPANPINVNHSNSSTTTARTSNIAGLNNLGTSRPNSETQSRGRFSGSGHVLGGE